MMVLGVAACGGPPTTPSRPAPETPTIEGPRPNARAIFDAQLAAARAGDAKALRATFATDAVVVAAIDTRAEELVPMQWLATDPNIEVDEVVVKSFVERSDDRATWWSVTLELTESGRSEFVGKRALVISEIAVRGRVIAAITGKPRQAPGYARDDAMPNKTNRGWLAELVEDPTGFATATRPDAILVNARSPLVLEGEVREVDGVLQSNLADGGKLLVVTRQRRVVLVHVY